MSYTDDVRRHYLHDPLCSDEHYAHLVQQAYEADLAAEAEAERLDTDEALILGSLDNEDEGVYPGDMNIIAQAATLTHAVDALVRERDLLGIACFQAEVELGHAENTIRQLRGDLAFADAAAATDKNGAVRIVDELVEERNTLRDNLDAQAREILRLNEALEQQIDFKVGWVDATLENAAKALHFQREVDDLRSELEAANMRAEMYHDDRDVWQDDAVKAEANLDEAYALIREKDALIRTLQEELTEERGRLFRINRVVTGTYDTTNMLLEIRRALGIA